MTCWISAPTGAIVEEGVSHPQHARAPVTAALGRPLVEDNEPPDDVVAAAVAAANVIVIDDADSQERLNLVEDNDVAEQPIAPAEPVDSLHDYIHKMFDEIAASAEKERDVGGECAVVVEDQVTEAVANDAEGPDVAEGAIVEEGVSHPPHARAPVTAALGRSLVKLKVIFPNTSEDIILMTVVTHRHLQGAGNAMLESICDDLLDLRTYRKVDEHYNGSTNVGSDAAEVPGTSGREHRETPDESDAGAIVEEGVSHPQHARAPVTAALWRPLVEFDEIAAPAEEERDVGGECAVVVEDQVTEAVANDAEGPDVAAVLRWRGGAVARSPPRDPLQVNVDSVMQLFPDAQREHVEALVLAHVNHPDILTTVCNVMVETKYPKVPQVKKSRERDGNAQQTVQLDEIAAPAAEERDVGGECAVVVEDQVTEAVANDAKGPDVAAAAAVARSPPRDPLQVNVDSVEFSNYLDESFLKQKTSITYKNEAMNLLKNEFLKGYTVFKISRWQ
ncbi:PREDICTED: uncharacterized protein LOC106816543 [Priapulus caudatus]|uniref:Uncharacterized protein LOC106816543 n=1 Tax=Priapulus caudatus TaxID=37621 RepID=A0ABM1EWT3_PRICU|nr:PREDICTED: uncharacterized protein LOC106816543 [Priapulus caudatus]